MLIVKLDNLEAIQSENVILKDKLDKNEKVEKKDELKTDFGRIFKCKKCDKTFGSRGDLKTHKRNVHGEESKQLLTMLYKSKTKNLEQKLDLSNKFFKLQENETNECADLKSKFQSLINDSISKENRHATFVK